MSYRQIRSLEELSASFGEVPGLAGFAVVERAADCVEVRGREGGVIFVSARRWSDESFIEPYLVRSSTGGVGLVLVGALDELEGVDRLRERFDFAVLNFPVSSSLLQIHMNNWLAHVALRARAVDQERFAERYRYEIGELIASARAISSERDIHKLLNLILEKSRYVTDADAGSVYIVEGQAPSPRDRTLRFMISQNDSLKMDLREFTLPVDDKSIVGRAVITGELINIPDLYQLEQPDRNPWGFRHDKQFDRKSGYQGRSMLTVPMTNQRDEVIAVIQLINKRRSGAVGRLVTAQDFDRSVIPFDERAEELAATLASQAGISLENTLLYEDIRRLFEGFVKASVTAIESRDPTTSGHSYRVAQMTVSLAEHVDRESQGLYREAHFSRDDLKEIEYAGLLHDFGKVGVREEVLIKAKKLYEPDRELVLRRFDYIKKSLEADGLRRKLDLIVQSGLGNADRKFSELDEEVKRRLVQIDEFVAFVLQANEPTVLAEGSFDKLVEIAALFYLDGGGTRRPYLTDDEVKALRLPRGSLTAEERQEIESHVVHTYNFLETIPWGRQFGRIPAIAGSHHEKLDGTGYPRGLRAEEIRVETRMMTIADIFDALTAKDRPYKKAVPVEKALDIIGYEVKEGKCDAELFRIFRESKLWQRA